MTTPDQYLIRHADSRYVLSDIEGHDVPQWWERAVTITIGGKRARPRVFATAEDARTFLRGLDAQYPGAWHRASVCRLVAERMVDVGSEKALDPFSRDAVRAFAARLTERLRGRVEMSRGSMAEHLRYGNSAVALHCRDRGRTYETAIDDVEQILKEFTE